MQCRQCRDDTNVRYILWRNHLRQAWHPPRRGNCTLGENNLLLCRRRQKFRTVSDSFAASIAGLLLGLKRQSSAQRGPGRFQPGPKRAEPTPRRSSSQPKSSPSDEVTWEPRAGLATRIYIYIYIYIYIIYIYIILYDNIIQYNTYRI